MTKRDHHRLNFQIIADKASNIAETPEKGSIIMQEVINYCARGWAVHPLNSHKRPLLKGWQDKATTNADVFMQWLQEWPWANVGVVTGAVNNLLVLDVDGIDGINSLNGLDLPISPTVVTARGHHYYFNFPSILNDISTTRSGLLPGIDIRGRGGYITAPPSIHETGHQYYWSKPLCDDLPEPPMWLIQRLKPTVDLSRKTVVLNRISSHYAQGALKKEFLAVATASVGTRNARLNQAAFSMGTLVANGSIDVESVARILVQAALDAGLCRNEVEKTLYSGLSAGMQHPREVLHG